jgi:hypothetical protein
LPFDVPTITSLSHNGGTQEMGATLNTITISWTWAATTNPLTFAELEKNQDATTTDVLAGGTPNSQIFNGALGITKDNTATFTWTLTISNADGADADTTSAVTFLNRYYFGADANPNINSSAQVRALSGIGWSTGTTATVTITSAAQYLYYCYPKRFGEVSNIAYYGFDMTWPAPTTVSVTNASGFTEDYYVYRSEFQVTGTDIEIVFT